MSDTHLQVEKTKKSRPRKTLPALAVSASAEQMNDVNYSGKVDTTPISWESLPIYSLFSASPDGSFPLVKIAKNQYCDLRTNRSAWCGSGRCYRVVL